MSTNRSLFQTKKRQRKNAIIAQSPLQTNNTNSSNNDNDTRDSDPNSTQPKKRSSSLSATTTHFAKSIAQFGQTELIQDDGTLSKQFFERIRKTTFQTTRSNSPQSSTAVQQQSNAQSTSQSQHSPRSMNRKLSAIAIETLRRATGLNEPNRKTIKISSATDLWQQDDVQLRLFFGLRDLRLHDLKRVAQRVINERNEANNDMKKRVDNAADGNGDSDSNKQQEESQNRKPSVVKEEEENNRSNDSLDKRATNEEVNVIRIRLCVHLQDQSLAVDPYQPQIRQQVMAQERKNTKLSASCLNATTTKAEELNSAATEWTYLGHSETIEIDFSKETESKKTIFFKASVLVKFFFEKLYRLRYTLQLIRGTNGQEEEGEELLLSLGTCESYLAEIIGSRGSVCNFDLKSEQTRLSSLQVGANNDSSQMAVELQKKFSESLIGEKETFIDATLSLELLQKVPNSTGVYIMISQLFRSKEEPKTNRELLKMAPKDKTALRRKKTRVWTFRFDVPDERAVPTLQSIDKTCMFVPLFTTEATNANQFKDIRFRPFTLKPQSDENRIVLRLDVFSYDKDEKQSGAMLYKTLIGSHIISLDDMVAATLNASPDPAQLRLQVLKHVSTDEVSSSYHVGNTKQTLFKMEPPKVHEPKWFDAGFVKVNSLKVRRENIKIEHIQSLINSAIDYMKEGIRFKVIFGVDMTSDNKYPRNDPMLHYDAQIYGTNGTFKSEYERAMVAIGDRIDQYYANKTDFHIIGFGHTDLTPSQNLINIMMKDSVDPGIMSPDVSPFSQSTNQAWMDAVLSRYEHPLMKSQLGAVYRHACRVIQAKHNFSMSMQHVTRSLRYRSAEMLEMTGTLEIPKSITDTDASPVLNQHELVQDKMFGPNDFHHIISDVTEVCTQVKQSQQQQQSRLSLSLSESPLPPSDSPSPNTAAATSSSTGTPRRHNSIFSPLLKRRHRKSEFNNAATSQQQKQQQQQQQYLEDKRLMSSSVGLQFEKSGDALYPIYNILVILLSNDHIDIQETIYSIVEASHKAPLSIIIIGLGSGSAFKALRSIRMEPLPRNTMNTPEDATASTSSSSSTASSSSLSSSSSSSGGSSSSSSSTDHDKTTHKQQRQRQPQPKQRKWETVPQTNSLQFKGLRAARDVCIFARARDFDSIEAAVEYCIARIPQHLCRFFRTKQQQINMF